MERALRRRVGAAAVEIDTLKGRVRYRLLEPRKIDFAEIESAVRGAGYTLVKIGLDVEGTVARQSCATCGKDVAVLELPTTRQRLEIEGVTAGRSQRVRVTGNVRDWKGAHPVLEVKPSGSTE